MVDFPKPDLSTWQALADRETGEMRELAWATPEGIEVRPLYTAADRGSRDQRRPARHPAVSARAA